MTKEGNQRRSFRLKDKPATNYEFATIYKLAKKSAKAERDMNALKLQNKQIVKRRKLEATKKKYDDIFSSVVTKAYNMNASQVSPQYLASQRLTEKQRNLKRKFRRTFSEADVESSETDSEKDDDEIVVIEPEEVIVVDEEPFKCGCGRRFEQHVDCHRHMFADHGDDELFAECLTCGHRLDDVRTRHACELCGEFAVDLEDHLASHYRNCTAKSAVMECRFCTKQFLTVKEVMEHEKKHLLKPLRRPQMFYKCNECFILFTNQEALGVHYSNHIDVNLLFERLADLQCNIQAEKDECPFCRMNVSSRKTFRGHCLKQHYAACKSIVAMSPEQLKMDNQLSEEARKAVDELAIGIPFGFGTQVKMEVKEEPHDDGYPAC